MNKNKRENANEQNNKKNNVTRIQKVAILVLSILGAFMLWIYAIGYDSTLFERTFDGIPVVIEGESALVESKGYTLAREQEFSSITIVAKGKRSELNELDASDFRAVIDVSQSEGAGSQTLNIVVYSPNGIEVVSQSSNTATVFVDEFTQRDELLSVSVDTGNGYVMTEGITFVNAVANPISVVVSGPVSVLDSIEGAYVRFNLDGYEISDSVYGYGAIELRDKYGKIIDNPYVTVSDSTAYVAISVTKQKSIPVRVAFTGGMFDTSDVSLSVSAETVTVSGSPEAIDGIDELVLTIDETAIDGKAEFEYNIGSLLPKGVSNESGVSKITVDVELPKMSVRTYRVKAEDIDIINLPSGIKAEATSGLELKLIGARDAFDSFDFSKISVSADFDRVTVEPNGSYSANAIISLGEDSGVIYLLNESYTVNFTVNEEE